MVPLTREQADAFTTRMAARFKARVVDKERSVPMLAAALTLGAVGLFGPKVPGPEAFLNDFSTTIPDPEDVIANPLRPRALIALSVKARETPHGQVITVGQECHHADVVARRWPEAQWFYVVDDHSRAEEEVQAYVVTESLARRLTGQRRPLGDVLATLAGSYHLGETAQGLARELVTSAWASLDEFPVPPIEAAIAAHEILNELGVGWAS